MALKDIKTIVKYTLRDPMTLEELRDLMAEKWGDSPPSKYKYKKSLFGKAIKFDTVMEIQPTVTIKDNIITVRQTKGAKMEVGGMNIKDMKQRAAAFKEGGLKAAAFGGHDNFKKVYESVEELLQGKLA